MSAIREFMTPNPITVAANTPASEAARLMRDADIGILPVVDGGRLEGVVTDRDLAIEALAERGDVAVREIMSPNPVALSPDDAIERAEQLMSEHGVRRLMVCDGPNVVGIVSVGDLATRVSDSVAGEVMHETGPGPRTTKQASDPALPGFGSDGEQTGAGDNPFRA